MPELILEIGGRPFEVVCQPGEEPSLQIAASMLGAEAAKLQAAVGRTTEKQMLLLSGLMLADTMQALEAQLRNAEERLRMTEERLRQAEAKSAMLAANALKLETEANHRINPDEVERLRRENSAAAALIARMLDEVNSLAEEIETASAEDSENAEPES